MNDQMKLELQKGLKSRPVYIPAWYRYNDEGSHLNDVCIEQCKWYYFHRFEVKLLTDVLNVCKSDINIYIFLLLFRISMYEMQFPCRIIYQTCVLICHDIIQKAKQTTAQIFRDFDCLE